MTERKKPGTPASDGPAAAAGPASAPVPAWDLVCDDGVCIVPGASAAPAVRPLAADGGFAPPRPPPSPGGSAARERGE